MASNNLTVNTDQVLQIAQQMQDINEKLSTELRESKITVDNLANVWQSDAANETISAFDAFAAKYFQNYEDTINQYVTFLRTNVDQGYTETETANVNLAEAFK